MSPIVAEPTGISLSDSQDSVQEKTAVTVATEDTPKSSGDDPGGENDIENEHAIVVTGADAALHLLPLRDDFDSVLTFRSILLASGLACFQAVMFQIYQVNKPYYLLYSPIFLTKRFPVQTDIGHHPRNIYRTHRLLLGKCLGEIPSTR
jgi:hypothetical protein